MRELLEVNKTRWKILPAEDGRRVYAELKTPLARTQTHREDTNGIAVSY